MKKSTVILLSVIGVILIAGVVAIFSADRYAKRKVNEQLTRFKAENELPVTWKDLHVTLLSGRVRVDELEVHLALPDSETADTTFLDLSVPRLDVGPVNWITLARKRVVSVKRVRVHDVSIDLAQKLTKLKLHADSINLAVHDIRYSIPDSAFSYNDSVYLVQASHFSFTAPDGLFALMLGQLRTEDAGSIILTDFKGGNACRKEDFARLNGKQASTWAKFDISRVQTAPVNILRLALSQQVNIESADVEARRVEVYRDTHYPVKGYQPMPQEAMKEMEMPLYIGKVNVALDNMHVGVSIDGEREGTIDLNRAKVTVSNISNAKNATMRASIDARLNDDGKAHFDAAFDNNKRCSFSYTAEVHNTSGANFRDMTVSMLGLEVGTNIHAINASCEGDSKSLTGTFCMRYDSLYAHVDKANTITQLQKYAGVVNAFAPAVLLKHNPRMKNAEPQSYKVVKKRDPYQPFPIYMLGVLIDGVVMSVVPPAISKPVLEQIQAAQDKNVAPHN